MSIKKTAKKTNKSIAKSSAKAKTTVKKQKGSNVDATKAAKSPAKTKNKKILIKKDMTIGEAVQKYPASAYIMMKYGLHCVGCHVASWETIEQGASGHGIVGKDMEKMVDEMNQAAAKMKK